jgi:hypothetical protein
LISKTPKTKAPPTRSAAQARTFVAPDEGRLSAILEDVRTELKKREAPVFLDKAKQDQFLECVRTGLQFYGSRNLDASNFRASKFKAIKEHLDNLNRLLGALEPSEKVILDIEAERAFKKLFARSKGEFAVHSSGHRYGLTDGANLLLRVDGTGNYDTGFMVDAFEEDCALLAKALKPVVVSYPEKEPAKKYHLEPNGEQLIEFLGRMWPMSLTKCPVQIPGRHSEAFSTDCLALLTLKL